MVQKQKTKRNIAATIVMFLTILCTATACQAGKRAKKETADPPAPKQAIPIVLEVYAWQSEAQNLKWLADSYQNLHPEITIHANFLPTTEYLQQMLVLKKRGMQVDCILAPSKELLTVLKNKGLLKYLSSSVQNRLSENHYGTWYGEGEEICASYMLPYRQSRWAVYYNKTLFDRLGVEYPKEDWTWTDYEEIAVKLTTEQGGVKTYGSLSFEPDNPWWRVPARTAGANDPLKEEDLELFLEAAKWCYRLTYERKAQLPYTQQIGRSGYDNVFLKGDVGMYFSGDWSVPVLNQNILSHNLNFDYDIAPMPHLEGYKAFEISDAAVIALSETTAYEKEALDFMLYVAGEEGALGLARHQVLPAWNTPGLQQEYLNVSQMPEHAEYFFRDGELSSAPATPLYSESMEILKTEVMQYLLQAQTFEQTTENIKQQLNTLRQN